MKIPAEKRKEITKQISQLEINHCLKCPINTQLRKRKFAEKHCYFNCTVGQELLRLGKELLGGEDFKLIDTPPNIGRKAIPIDEEKLIYMYQNNYSYEEMEKEFGISSSAIRTRLQKLGVYRYSKHK